MAILSHYPLRFTLSRKGELFNHSQWITDASCPKCFLYFINLASEFTRYHAVLCVGSVALTSVMKICSIVLVNLTSNLKHRAIFYEVLTFSFLRTLRVFVVIKCLISFLKIPLPHARKRPAPSAHSQLNYGQMLQSAALYIGIAGRIFWCFL